jgi:hypothetical protein
VIHGANVRQIRRENGYRASGVQASRRLLPISAVLHDSVHGAGEQGRKSSGRIKDRKEKLTRGAFFHFKRLSQGGISMNLHLHFTVEYLLAIIAGIAILSTPKLLSYIVAIYLIAVGVIGILGLKI